MTVWSCGTCAVEHPESPRPPQMCVICSDDRQYLPASGQRWTTQQQWADEGHRVAVDELEPNLRAVTVTPSVGIGHRSFLLQTSAGNLLFDPPGVIDAAGVQRIGQLGGITVIASSHPHLTGCSVQWSRAFDRAPVYVSAKDAEWIRRPDPSIELWEESIELLPGVRMVECGGHFAGSSVVHWQEGAEGRGLVLSGDTIAVGADRRSVNVMRSYVNNIPLPERAVRRIMNTVSELSFDRLYTAFGGLDADASATVDWSLTRYIRWLRDEIPE